MRIIGFIGSCDKTDLLLNIAKILTVMKNRVLLIDSTIIQKARYIVPTIMPSKSYITSFEDIDVAVGFDDFLGVQRYLGGITDFPYDVVLVDCDVAEKVKGFDLQEANKNYFVTNYDVYSVRRGIEILNNLESPMKLQRIVFTKEILREDDEYLTYISKDAPIVWEEERLYFPLDIMNFEAAIENQRSQKIKFKKLSVPYKDSLNYLVLLMMELNSDSEIKKAMKIIEKGV